jgi:hypothetical protein
MARKKLGWKCSLSKRVLLCKCKAQYNKKKKKKGNGGEGREGKKEQRKKNLGR